MPEVPRSEGRRTPPTTPRLKGGRVPETTRDARSLRAPSSPVVRFEFSARPHSGPGPRDPSETSAQRGFSWRCEGETRRSSARGRESASDADGARRTRRIVTFVISDERGVSISASSNAESMIVSAELSASPGVADSTLPCTARRPDQTAQSASNSGKSRLTTSASLTSPSASILAPFISIPMVHVANRRPPGRWLRRPQVPARPGLVSARTTGKTLPTRVVSPAVRLAAAH